MITLSLSKFRAVLSVAVLALAALPSMSHAQSKGVLVRANIPFAFEVGSKHFVPGLYTIRTDNEYSLSVRSGSNSALIMTSWDTGLTAPAASKVIFHKYGDRYFMAEVWSSASAGRLLCVKSRSEQQAQKLERAARSERASVQPENTNVEVALSETSR